MSRKSKRRRMRQLRAEVVVGRDPADGLEFLDDRSPRAGTASETPAAPAPSSPGAPAVVETVACGPQEAPVEIPAAASAEPTAAAPPAAPMRTLGEILTSAREAGGLSVEEASARTRISAKMILNLENDRFGEFAAEAYARGSLRSYGGFLGLDVAELMLRFEALRGRAAEAAPQLQPQPQPVWEPDVEAVTPRRPGKVRRTADTRRLIVTAVAAFAVMMIAAGVYLVQRGVLRLRPEPELTQIENELQESRSSAPAASAGGRAESTGTSPAPAAAEDAPAPFVVGLAEDTSPELLPEPGASALVLPGLEERHVEAKPFDRGEIAVPPPATRRRAAAEPQPPVVGKQAAVAGRQEPAADVRTAIARTPPAPRSSPAVGARVPESNRREAPLPITDLVEEPSPQSSREARTAARLDPLVLTAAARDTCTLKLAIDTEGGRSQQIRLQPGEARSWTARDGFQVSSRRGSKLDLWVNGRPISLPGDGRSLRIDRSSLQPEPATPARQATSRSGRRNRRRVPPATAQSAVPATAGSRTPGPLP